MSEEIAAPQTPPTRTSLHLSSSTNPVLVGRQVAYTAQVGPAPDGGHVSFYDDGHLIPNCTNLPVSPDGMATCRQAYTQPGAHGIRARYSGTTHFTNSTSNRLTERVRRNHRRG